jgi:nucleotide-binding universal stress UspA family protein
MDVLCGIDGSATSRDALQQVRASFTFGGDVTVEVLIDTPDPVAALRARADEALPELLVMGSDADPRILSSTALEGRCSVLVSASPNAIRRVVVATDGSLEAQRALELFVRLPFRQPPEVVVVTVIDPRDKFASVASGEPGIVAHAIAAEAAAELRPMSGHVEVRTPTGMAAEMIAVVADEIDADLIVLGTRGLSAQQRRRVGSVAQALIDRMPTSLLIARASAA